jgi:hypothetical protein
MKIQYITQWFEEQSCVFRTAAVFQGWIRDAFGGKLQQNQMVFGTGLG